MPSNALLPRLALALLVGVALPAAALAQDTAAPAAETAPATETATAAAAPVDPATVVATVDGIEITEGDLALAAQDPALPLPGMNDAQRRETLINYLVNLELAARAAEEAGIGASETFERRLAYQRDKLLLESLLEETIDAAVTDEAARAVYDEMVAEVEPEQEVRARHILVDTQEEAQAVVERIAAGESFEGIATDLSTDRGSAAEGGDLGFFTKGQMVAPFAEAAFALEPGAISEPVQSQFGWHVIEVQERRERPTPTFEQMREQIDTFLARQAQQALLLSLREGVEIARPGAEAQGEAPAPAPQ
ncbi:peptidylprolyl isomerase [Salinarimonas rosea]|uniref:peptidylprolyl isomerase n=1 Tax=Salinarimonas rosea TaxID=552063 RepID=UPI000419742A|nr:peptidylprolyl isomerase [Salinarimonas rosea]